MHVRYRVAMAYNVKVGLCLKRRHINSGRVQRIADCDFSQNQFMY